MHRMPTELFRSSARDRLRSEAAAARRHVAFGFILLAAIVAGPAALGADEPAISREAAEAGQPRPTAAAAAAAESRRYAVPDIGTLQLAVPRAWKEEVTTGGGHHPFALTVKLTGPGPEDFVALVSVERVRLRENVAMEPRVLREALEEVLRRQTSEVPDGAADIQPMSGPGWHGFQASRIDTAWKPGTPGDYHYATRGFRNVDGFIIAFTILSNERDSAAVRQALEVVRSAVRIAEPAAVHVGAEAASCRPGVEARGTPSEIQAELNAGEAAFREHRFADAERRYRRVLAMLEAGGGGSSTGAAGAAAMLGAALGAQQKHGEAAACYRRALDALHGQAGVSPEFAQATRCQLVGQLWRARRREEAEAELARIGAAGAGAAEARSAEAVCALGTGLTLSREGRATEAEGLLRRALALFDADPGPAGRVNAALAASSLSVVMLSRGEAEQAETLARRAVPVLEQALGRDNRQTAVSVQNLGAALIAQGKLAEAEPYLRRSLAQAEGMWVPDPGDVCRAANSLAYALVGQRRHSDAEPVARKAVAACEKAFGPDSGLASWSGRTLGAALNGQGRHGEAEPILRRALAAKEAVTVGNADTAAELARALEALGKTDEAKALRERYGVFRK